MKFLPLITVALSLLSVASAVPLDLSKRRFNQEHTPEADATYQAMKDISAGTVFSERLGNLSGRAVNALLARADKCAQQDVADECIDIAKEMEQDFPEKVQDLTTVCKTYRTLERNTPNVGQPSELCDRPPRNKEIEGLVQRQDPTGPNQPTSSENPSSTTSTTSTTSPTPESNPTETPAEPVVNNEAFNNPVGGVQMPLITQLDNGKFEVNGVEINDLGAAQNRQCDIQHNLCMNKFNSGDRSFSNSDCDEQTNVCKNGDPVFSAFNLI